MEKISYEEIDFSVLEKQDIESLESDIYTDGMDVYKIFKPNMNMYNLVLKSEKIDRIDKIKTIPKSIVVPSSVITKGNRIVGTVEDYIHGIDLTYIDMRYDVEDIAEIFYKISKELEKIHKSEIVLSDLNSGNIRIDTNMKPHFLDFLSYSFCGISANAQSYILSEYLKSQKKKTKDGKNCDRISLLLIAYNILTKKNFIEDFDIEKYDQYKKDKKIEILEDLREIFLALQCSYVQNIPYLHKLLR